MQQLVKVWSGLDMRRRVIAGLATVAMFVAILAMSRMATTPSMTLLYAGLESSAAGDVVSALEQRNVPFEVRGGSIYVPSTQRDELRLTLAGEGLPMTGGRGYELLDSLNGFGTTSQMFDAAYWRAKEGELARTIVAGPFVAQARVHIAHSGTSPFQRRTRPTASVSVVPAGASVTAAQANALRYLVVSAVAGLAVEDVAVIDANGRLIGPADDTGAPGNADDRAQRLRERVLRLVEARVGTGNAVVEVSVDTVTETESIRERRFDPEGRVAISTETEERSDSSQNQAAGDVTVASNLPDGGAAQGDGSRAQASETRERVNYEVSETEHEILRAPGAIKRLTVAVLVNDLAGTDPQGNVTTVVRPAQELDALRDLVASAVGFQEDRGDIITIRSMELPAAEPPGTAATARMLNGFELDVMLLLQIAVLSVTALVLGIFVLRPILTGPAEGTASPRALSGPDLSAAPEFGGSPALMGEIDDEEFTPLPQFSMSTGNDGGGSLGGFGGEPTDPVARLRNMIGDRQEETVEILRSWLEETGEPT